MKIELIEHENVHRIARLHITGIPVGFISSLGEKFLTVLYEAIAKDKNSFCLVAEEEGQLLGFAAFTESIGQLYKSVIKSHCLKLLPVLALKMIRPSVFKRVIQNILYPGKSKKLGLPQAELLSIVVDSAARGKGVAKMLCEAGFDECRKRGIDKVKVLVAAENIPANKLYKKCGFKFVTEVDSHGVLSNIYIADLAKTNNDNL